MTAFTCAGLRIAPCSAHNTVAGRGERLRLHLDHGPIMSVDRVAEFADSVDRRSDLSKALPV